MSILVFNAGSSSLKFGLFDEGRPDGLLSGEIDWAHGDRQRARLILRSRHADEVRSQIGVPDDRAAALHAIRVVTEEKLDGGRQPPKIAAVGHRVVHGGSDFQNSALIDSKVKNAIARWAELAPLHNPAALVGIEVAEEVLPGVPQVAVFDTAFYAQLPPRAYIYPLPYEWYKDWGVRRFGFHGISHAYCAGRAAELLRRDISELRIVTCHLGGGCSATAVRGGVAIATTLGFSPIEGLMMGTRSGSVDPGILTCLLRRRSLTVDELEHALNYSSGLLGVSGVSADLAEIERSVARGNERARLAFDIFADRVRSAVGALTVTMGGIDALIFTDRVGEHSINLRAAVCGGLECLGLRLDRHLNSTCRSDADIATIDSPARILMIHTREELMVARETKRVLDSMVGCTM